MNIDDALDAELEFEMPEDDDYDDQADHAGLTNAMTTSQSASLKRLRVDHSLVCPRTGRILGSILEDDRVSLQVLELNHNIAGVGSISSQAAMALSKGLTINTKLRELAIENYALGDLGFLTLSVGLCMNQHLEILRLRKNNIGQAGGMAIGEVLRTNNSLKVVDLASNVIDADAAKTIAESLLSNMDLEELNLNMNRIGDEGAATFGAVLYSNSTIQKLSLCANGIGDEGVKELFDAISGNDSSSILEDIDLSNNPLISPDGINAIFSSLIYNTSLQRLKLTENNFTDYCAPIVREALAKNDTLEELTINESNLEMKVLTCLAEGLSLNSSLRTLDLSYNNFSSVAIESLCQGLMENNSLEKIILAGNAIVDSRAAVCISESLSISQTLKYLDLSENNLSDQDAHLMSKFIKNSPCIETTSFGFSSLGCKGVTAMFDALCMKGKTLTEIKIFGIDCLVDDKCSSSISKALKTNSNLQSIKLGITKNHDGLLKSIASAIINNTTLQKIEFKLNDLVDYSKIKALFEKALFFPSKLESVLKAKPNSNNESITFYSWRNSARTTNNRGRLPFQTALVRGLKWTDGVREILAANPSAILETDLETNLLPFMLAASSPQPQLDTVYNVLRAQPSFWEATCSVGEQNPKKRKRLEQHNLRCNIQNKQLKT